MEQPYHPISCARHSELELAILRKNLLTVQWLDPEGEQQQATLQPLDLTTRKQGEFLLARKTVDHTMVEIRLDKIVSSEIITP